MLMQIRGKGEGNQERRKRELRNLAEACRAGTRHHKVGGGISLFHTVMEGSNMRGNTLPLVIDGSQVVIALPGEMNDLQGLVLFVAEILQKSGRAEEELVDSGCTLAPTHH